MQTLRIDHLVEKNREGQYYVVPFAVPEGVEEIGYAAFEGAALTEVTLPDSLIKIGTAAFMDCTALESLALPEGLKYAGEQLVKRHFLHRLCFPFEACKNSA